MAGPVGPRSTNPSHAVRGSQIIIAMVIGVLIRCLLTPLTINHELQQPSLTATIFRQHYNPHHPPPTLTHRLPPHPQSITSDLERRRSQAIQSRPNDWLRYHNRCG